MNLEYLRYFMVLGRLQHYSKAAEQLHISQPGLSHAITALEKTMGVPLFQKTGRGIVLSEYGEMLLPEAEKIVSRLDDCIHSFHHMKEGGGIIRISSVTPVASTLVAKLTQEFLRSNPNCDFTFSVGMSSEIYSALKEHRIDIGFCSKVMKDPEILYTSVHKQHMVVIVPEGHPLEQREAVRLVDTLAYPHVTFSWRSGLRSTIDHLFSPVRAQWNIVYEVEDADFILGLVANGFGITVMPEIPVTHLHAGVKILRLSEPNWESHFYILRRKEKYLLNSIEEYHRFFLQRSKELSK